MRCMVFCMYIFFFKQKTAYDMRISDWSSDVFSSDLDGEIDIMTREGVAAVDEAIRDLRREGPLPTLAWSDPLARAAADHVAVQSRSGAVGHYTRGSGPGERSEEHTSELQSLMRISYAVFCLKKKKETDAAPDYSTTKD